MLIENLKKAVLEQIKDEHQCSPVRGCAMQLLEIVGENIVMARLVLEDMEAGQKVRDCEKEIKAFVDKNHKGNSGYCPPEKAEEIIRTFFGLGSGIEEGERAAAIGSATTARIVDLSQFL